MTDGIDDAAAAFSADMNPGASRRDTSERPSSMGIEDLFTPRQKEVDDESPSQGGGDDEVIEEERRPRRRATVDTDEAEEDDDPLYADEPEGPKKDDEPEEDDDEPEKDDEPEEDEGETVDIDPDTEVTVMVDGKEKIVTVKEALEGYIRTETFYGRLNELTTTKTEMQKEARVLLDDRKAVIELGKQMQTELEALLPAEPDWDAEFAKDPATARHQQKIYDTIKGKIDGLRKTQAEQQAKFQSEQVTALKNFGDAESTKFNSLPENQHWLSDPKKKGKDMDAMVRTARAVGFTNEEIAGTLDSRMLTILLRASKYDRIMAKKPQLKSNGVKPTRPGQVNVPRARASRKGIDRAQTDLQRTGSTEDAARVFQNILAQPKPRNRRR